LHPVLPIKRLLHLRSNYLLRSVINFPSTVFGKTAIGTWNVMPEEEEVQNHGNGKTDSGDHPNNQREQHAKQNDSL